MQRLKRLTSAFVVALVLLSAGAAGSGTVTKIFPDVNEHVGMFIEFKLGMTQREFRTRVPMAWRVIAFDPDLRQNVNDHGEVDPGRFSYHFVARGTHYPIMSFYFSDGKIIYADLASRTNDKEDVRAHYDARLLATKTLQASFGIILNEDKKKDHYVATWSSADADISVIFRKQHLPIASLTLTIQVPHKFWEWHDWYYRGTAIARKGKGPLTILYCEATDRDKSHNNVLMWLIDTRGLTEKRAREIAQHNEGQQGRFHCEGASWMMLPRT